MKQISLILAGVIMLLAFSSCTRPGEIDIAMQEHAANLSAEKTYYGAEPEDEYYGNFLHEVSYVTLHEQDWEGIVNPSEYPSDFTLCNDRLYYSVYKPIPTDSSQSYSIVAFVDLVTGEQSYLCSDPVCTHEYGSDCLAINIAPCQYWNDRYIEIRFIETINHSQDLEITITDLHSGTREVIAYFNANSNGEISTLTYGTSFIHNNIFYFNIRKSYTDLSSKTQIQVTENYAYDLINRTLSEPIESPEHYQNAAPVYFDGTYVYWFVPYYAFLITDENFENEKLLCDFGGVTPNQSNWYYDTETGEMFYLLGNKKDQTGTIYCIKNGEAETLTLPHENICYFFLTRDKIYYSTYEHAYAMGARQTGQDVLGDTVYENGGGIVYVTDRGNCTNAELFFDNGQVIDLYMHDGWIVLDGNLYMLSMSYRTENTVTFARRPYQKVMRINPANNTIRYFRFD
jgi:hypothetical protein